MSEVVNYRISDGVAVLTLSSGRLGVLTQQARIAMSEALSRAQHDEAARAIVIASAGDHFSNGLDLAEQDRGVTPPLADLCNQIADSSKPIVAALKGRVTGGGLELALAAQGRVAVQNTVIGFLDISLGMIPSAGATQRLPRLVGAKAALDILLSNTPQPVSGPLGRLCVDRVERGDPVAAASDLARALAADEARPAGDMQAGLADPVTYQAQVKARRETLERGGDPAARAMVDCVEAALLLPLDAGLAFESAWFEDIAQSDRAAALRHVHIAERRAAWMPELTNGKAHRIENVGIFGGGYMGANLCISALDAGFRVVMFDEDETARREAKARITAVYGMAVRRKRLDEAKQMNRLARLTVAEQEDELATADVILDAVADRPHRSQTRLARLARVVGETTVIAVPSNPSEMSHLTPPTDSDHRILGLHFYSPAHVVRLAEINPGTGTSEDSFTIGVWLARKMGKIAVRSAATAGTIGQRIIMAMRRAAEAMVMAGASPYEIDDAMHRYGFRLGPFRMIDHDGLEATAVLRDAMLKAEAAQALPVLDRLIASGRLGEAAGRGYYRYDRRAKFDEEVIDILEEIRSGDQEFPVEEIQRRCLAAMVNEGAKLVAEGAVLRVSDIDVVMVNGCGFPRDKGGPMKAADLAGIFAVLQDLEAYGAENPAIWQPHPSLHEMVKNGQTFADIRIPENK